MPPKTVSVIGFKNSGKTRVVEAIVKELTDRGHKVATLKHTADDIVLDSPGKDTSRHREAGSIATGILQENSTALFIDQNLSIHQASEKLGVLDYLVIEGFKTIDTHARVIVPREDSDCEKLDNGLVIATVKVPESKYIGDATPLSDMRQLADIVEMEAYPMLPGIDCHSCGFDTCRQMGMKLVSKDAKIEQCVGYRKDRVLKVNGTYVPMGNFVREAMQNVMLGFIKSLKGGEDPKKVELLFEVIDDE
jgi:molybdopterin-guanine dinucleotide biosynthesis protein B